MANEKTPYVWELDSGQLITFMSSITEKKGDTYSAKRVRNTVVKAPLPETLNLSVANEVNQMFSIFQIKSDIIQYGSAGVLNKNFDRGWTQREYWRGPENTDMTIELNFDAYYSGITDVMIPTQNLLMLGASRENSFQGGEHDVMVIDAHWDGPDNVVVKFGKYFWHKSMIIKNVEVSYGNKLDRDFNPMSAVASITMIPSDPMGFAVVHGGSYFGGMQFDINQSTIAR